jgi:hypothetical protein
VRHTNSVSRYALSKELPATAGKDFSTPVPPSGAPYARNDILTPLSFRAQRSGVEGPSARKTHGVFSEVGWEPASTPRALFECASAQSASGAREVCDTHLIVFRVYMFLNR